MVSTSVIATAKTKTLATHATAASASGEAAIVVAMPSGMNRSISSVMYSSSLSADGPLDEGEVWPGVLEHHRLMDHREFQVRRRIVYGNATGLGDQHDEEPGQRKDVARAKERARNERAAHNGAKIERPRRERSCEEPQHQSGLGERRNRHLAAAAHAAKRAAGIEGGDRKRKPAERENPNESKDSTGALQGRRRDQDRYQRRRCHGRGEVQARPERVYPGGGLRSHNLFSQQLGEIVSTPAAAADPSESASAPSSS